MKKYLITISAIILLLTGTIVWAKGQPSDPMGAVWDAIRNLQTQINNIQLTPGPQGEQGIQGEQGLVGPAGQNLKVFDADGKEVGIYVGGEWTVVEGMEEYVYIPNYNAVLRIDEMNVINAYHVYGTLLYTTNDCTGTAYKQALVNEAIPYKVSEIVDNGRDGMEYMALGKIQKNVSIKSRWNSGTETCGPYVTSLDAMVATPAELNFTGPFELRAE